MLKVITYHRTWTHNMITTRLQDVAFIFCDESSCHQRSFTKRSSFTLSQFPAPWCGRRGQQLHQRIFILASYDIFVTLLLTILILFNRLHSQSPQRSLLSSRLSRQKWLFIVDARIQGRSNFLTINEDISFIKPLHVTPFLMATTSRF